MSETSTLVMLDPTLTTTRTTVLSPRLDTLSGKTIGIIWNGRPPGDVILGYAMDELRKRYAIKDIVLLEKPYLGNVAPDAILDELEATCDAVVTGVGD
jgi:hypothetical protein